MSLAAHTAVAEKQVPDLTVDLDGNALAQATGAKNHGILLVLAAPPSLEMPRAEEMASDSYLGSLRTSQANDV
jgi:hypothetical protein